MKVVTDPTEWVDRYVSAVGRLMPAAQRADVEREIRSLIADAVDAATPSGDTPDEEVIFSVLRNFGKPEEIAARYRAPAYLVGPALYPTFRTVVGIVLGVLAGVSLFGAAVGVGLGSVAWNPVDLLANLVGSLIQVFGTVVGVFALIEFFQRRGSLALEDTAGKGSAWDVRSLPPVQDDDRANVGELASGIVGAVIAIFLFNALPSGLTGMVLNEEGWQFFPLFAPEFWRYVPWLTALWLLEIALNSYVIARGRWSTPTRWLEAGLSALGVAAMLVILTGGPIAAYPALDTPFKIVVAIIFAVESVQLARQLYRLVVRKPGQSAPGIPSAGLR